MASDVTPQLLDVVPLNRRAVLPDVPVVLVAYEEWSDRGVLRLAAPGPAPVDVTGDGSRWVLRRGDAVVARTTGGGGGYRGGLNACELHFAPPTPYAPGLSLVLLDADGGVVHDCTIS